MKKNKYILVLLFCLFMLPGIAALFLYQHPDWLKQSTTNKGTLITPPPLIETFTKNQWYIVVSEQKKCQGPCMARLEQLAKMRLALGRRLYNVQLCLLLAPNTPSLSIEQQNTLKDAAIEWKTLMTNSQDAITFASKKSSIFIVSPAHYLILEYSKNALLSDIFHDIKHLLQVTEGKNGS